MSTLATMRQNVRDDLIIDPNGDIWSDARIDRFIHEFLGMTYSWDQKDFGETSGTLTLVASTASYDLSSELSNYSKLRDIKLTGRNVFLTEIEQSELDEFLNGRDETYEGEPLYYWFYGDDTINLWPVPNGDITTASVRFERSSPTLADDESPAFDSRWHYVCELYARWRCFSTVPGHEKTAETAELTFIKESAKMKEDLWRRNNSGYRFTPYNQVAWPV